MTCAVSCNLLNICLSKTCRVVLRRHRFSGGVYRKAESIMWCDCCQSIFSSGGCIWMSVYQQQQSPDWESARHHHITWQFPVSHYRPLSSSVGANHIGNLKTIMWCDDFWLFSNQVILAWYTFTQIPSPDDNSDWQQSHHVIDSAFRHIESCEIIQCYKTLAVCGERVFI